MHRKSQTEYKSIHGTATETCLRSLQPHSYFKLFVRVLRDLLLDFLASFLGCRSNDRCNDVLPSSDLCNRFSSPNPASRNQTGIHYDA